MSEFGTLLRQFRERAGKGQFSIGSRAGLDSSYIGRLESGSRPAPRRTVVDALIAALNLSGMDAGTLLVAAGYVPSTGVVVVVNGRLASLTEIDADAQVRRPRLSPVNHYGKREGACDICGDYSKPIRARGKCNTHYQEWRRGLTKVIA